MAYVFKREDVCVYLSVGTCMNAGALVDQERALDLLELQLQAVVGSCPICGLRILLLSSAGAERAVNH